MRKFLLLIFLILISVSINAGEFIIVENGGFELGTIAPFIVGEGNVFIPIGDTGDMNWDQSVKDWDTLVNTSDMNGIYNIKAIGTNDPAGTYVGFIYHPDFGSHNSVAEAGRIKVTYMDYDDHQNIVVAVGGVSAIDGNNVLYRSCGVTSTVSFPYPLEFIFDFNQGSPTCISPATPYPVLVLNLTPSTDVLGIDNISYAERDSLKLTVTEPNGDPVPTNTDFNINVTVQNNSDLNFLENGLCNMFFDGGGAESMYNAGSGLFTYTNNQALANTFDYIIKCSVPEFADTNTTGSIKTQVDLSEYLTITPITNISSYSVDFNGVVLNLSDAEEDFSFRVESSYPNPIDVDFFTYNSNADGKQYFIYTASDSEYDTGTWVFDETLTYGSTNSNPVQKIWDETNSRYTHSIIDELNASDSIYYQFRYRSPHKHWFSIKDSPEWTENLKPNVIDNDTFNIDEYSISKFANIRSLLIQNVPDIFEDETSAFEFQVTAYSDVGGTLLIAGKTLYGSDTIETVSLTTEPHTYSFTITADNFDDELLLASTDGGDTANIYITDYSIIARGFFTKRLGVLKKNRNPLDVILISSESERYILEGSEFYLISEAYDREGNLSRLELEAYLISTAVGNLARKTTFGIDEDGETHFEFDELMPAIIDLNGTATIPAVPRSVILRANLYDTNGTRVATQSQTFKFIQYPYFPNDLEMHFYPTEKRLGKHPSGILELSISNIDVLEGLDFRIYNTSNTASNPTFRFKLYKDKDFTCTTGKCTLQIIVDDFIYEDLNQTHITIFALLNTEYLHTGNRLTREDRTIYVTTIEFDVAKIQQVMHRVDRTYTENEEIPLVLVLRDSEATNIFNKLNITVSLQNCNDAGGSFCLTQTTKYKPTGFIYDDKTNLNFYYFRHLYLLDNGELLPDGNYIGFRASVTDQTGVISNITPVLADKCKNNDIDATWFLGQISSFLLGHWDVGGLIAEFSGCTTVQEQIVTTTTNNDQETRLLIDEDHSVTSPSQELFACISPDQNNVYNEPLKQELVCMTWYTQAEKPIDDFRIRITNQYSDLSNTDDTKQYVEFNIPFEVVASNDIISLRKQLETDQTTTIDTIGEFFFEGLRRSFTDYVFTDKLNDYDTFLLGNGLITNVGADLNFNQAFSPANITGATFYRIKGISVVNANDYRFSIGEDFENIDRTNFLNYLAENNINANTQTAELELIINDFSVPVKFIDSRGSLVIDEEPITSNINTGNVDKTTNYNFIPNELIFTLQNTMFFNNFSENDTRAIVLRVLTQVRDTGLNPFLQFTQDFLDDPAIVFQNLLFSYIVLIAIIMGLLIVVSIAYRNFSREGV